MDFKFDLLYNGSVYLFMSYKKSWNVECGMWNVECGMWNVE